MKLDHSVRVPATIADVWQFLDDTSAVVACMPGAELTETVDRDNHRGQVKLSIGPLAMNYSGDVAVLERNDADYRMKLDASGRDRRGSGTARATVDLTLTPDGDHTSLAVVSDIRLTGRIASLGRGVQDVSNKLFIEFADNVADRLDGYKSASQSTPATSSSTPAAVPQQQQAAAGVDSTIKVAPLVWSIVRQRVADFLERLSKRVRPND